MALSPFCREELKWLQGLDLSYSVKNVKRDFSNGFLVAEIFSRYYAQDVEMHSFDNGQSLQRKLDNWAQLIKFFNKKSIQLDRNAINDVGVCQPSHSACRRLRALLLLGWRSRVRGLTNPARPLFSVHCKSNEAPAQLISSIYAFLTGRQPKQPTRDAGLIDPASMPSYARPNETSLLRANIKESEEQTILQDRDTHAGRTSEIIGTHEAAARVQLKNAALASKLATTASNYGAVAMQRVLRGQPKPMTQEAAFAVPVTFQEVKVRSVDRNIAALRANKEIQNSAAGDSYAGSVGGGGAPSSPAYAAQPEVGNAPLRHEPVRGVLSILSDHVTAVASKVDLTDRLAADAYNDFLKRLPTLADEAAAAPFVSASADAEALAAACVASPKEAWALFHLLTSAIACAGGPSVAAAVAGTLTAAGRALCARDPTLAGQLLLDFGLPRLVPLLKAAPAQAMPLLEAVYGFTAQTDHAHVRYDYTIGALTEPHSHTHTQTHARAHTHTHSRARTHARTTHTRTHTHTHARTHARARAHTHTHTHARARAYTHARTHTRKHAHARARTHARACARTHTHTHTHARTHTHTHSHA